MSVNIGIHSVDDTVYVWAQARNANGGAISPDSAPTYAVRQAGAAAGAAASATGSLAELTHARAELARHLPPGLPRSAAAATIHQPQEHLQPRRVRQRLQHPRQPVRIDISIVRHISNYNRSPRRVKGH